MVEIVVSKDDISGVGEFDAAGIPSQARIITPDIVVDLALVNEGAGSATADTCEAVVRNVALDEFDRSPQSYAVAMRGAYSAIAHFTAAAELHAAGFRGAWVLLYREVLVDHPGKLYKHM